MMPQKGKAKELVRLGATNAEEYLRKWLNDKAGSLDKINKALEELKAVLKLNRVPQRIEGFDISNIAGTNAVGSMVVFEKGLPKKSEYRKFKIKVKSTPDDFAMMREMLERRIARSKKQEARMNAWPTPDLIVIDGGKGQLSAALEIFRSSDFFDIPVIGLAKRIEEIFLPGRKEAIILERDNPALQLLQRLRDEAHRFGVAYHRDIRSKQAIRSALDDIPGIGPKTKKLLKAKFGAVANIRKTSIDDLSSVVGEHIAQLIQQSL
jgi:excinuclease ABC subunit C